MHQHVAWAHSLLQGLPSGSAPARVNCHLKDIIVAADGIQLANHGLKVLRESCPCAEQERRKVPAAEFDSSVRMLR